MFTLVLLSKANLCEREIVYVRSVRTIRKDHFSVPEQGFAVIVYNEQGDVRCVQRHAHIFCKASAQ